MSSLYVDDKLMMGNKPAIDAAKKEIGNRFKIKDLGKLVEYIGCNIKRNGNVAYLYQEDIIKKLEKSYGEEVKNLRTYDVPMGAGVKVVRPVEGDTLLNDDYQRKYRSGVGTLLYLVKHSRPELSNSVRELAKVMDGANRNHYKLLLRVIKYTLDTKRTVLKLKPDKNKERILEGYADSDHAGDCDNRRSVTGYIILYAGVLIAKKSRVQKTVALSSTEAEYYAYSEATAELMYCKQILEFLGIEVQTPMILNVDNTGAMYLANNEFTSQRTKHIDCRYHYVRELIENKILQINFVRSENNKADIYTKNLNSKSFKSLTQDYMVDIDEDEKNCD
jgi:hypothetical protein